MAIACASRLAQLQVTEPLDSKDPVRGFYRAGTNNSEPYRDISNGCWHLFGLCDLVELFPDHPDAESWRNAIRLYTDDYLAAMSKRNSFGIVPYGFHRKEDPGAIARSATTGIAISCGRRTGGWASTPTSPRRASGWFGPRRSSTSRSCERWPSASSTGFSAAIRSTPARWWASATTTRRSSSTAASFSPPTPLLPGAVMNGLGGTMDDQPFIGDGVYNVSEYWTPMVSYTMWLMAVLQQS